MIGKLQSGEVVVDRFHSHNHTETKLIEEALFQISSFGRKFLTEVVDFGRPIGETICVSTTAGDDTIIFAQRPRRFGFTRFVKNRSPEPCNTLVVVLKADNKGGYVLISAFCGRRAEPEPWDDRNFSQQSDPSAAREASRRFWSSHALVWGSEPVIPGTETTRYPWTW